MNKNRFSESEAMNDCYFHESPKHSYLLDLSLEHFWGLLVNDQVLLDLHVLRKVIQPNFLIFISIIIWMYLIIRVYCTVPNIWSSEYSVFTIIQILLYFGLYHLCLEKFLLIILNLNIQGKRINAYMSWKIYVSKVMNVIFHDYPLFLIYQFFVIARHNSILMFFMYTVIF